MPNIKVVPQISDWLAYELSTQFRVVLDAPLRLRLRPVNVHDMARLSAVKTMSVPTNPDEWAMLETYAIESVVEWDLTEGGEPIAVTPETKEAYLRPCLGELVKERGVTLATAIWEDASAREVFLKN